MKDSDVGIYCYKNNVVYYLSYGKNSNSPLSLNRLYAILVQRGLIEYGVNNPRTESQYKTMTVREAREKNLEIKTVFLNNHVKKHGEQFELNPARKLWGKKKIEDDYNTR